MTTGYHALRHMSGRATRDRLTFEVSWNRGAWTVRVLFKGALDPILEGYEDRWPDESQSQFESYIK